MDGEREGSGGCSAQPNTNTTPTTNEFDPLSLLSNKDIENFQVLCWMEVASAGVSYLKSSSGNVFKWRVGTTGEMRCQTARPLLNRRQQASLMSRDIRF